MPEVQQEAPRTAALIVTSENRAEFMTKRMDLKAPAEAAKPETPVAPAAEVKVEPVVAAPVPAKPEEEATKLEAELKAEEAKPQPDEKKKQTIRERISEITEK